MVCFIGIFYRGNCSCLFYYFSRIVLCVCVCVCVQYQRFQAFYLSFVVLLLFLVFLYGIGRTRSSAHILIYIILLFSSMIIVDLLKHFYILCQQFESNTYVYYVFDFLVTYPFLFHFLLTPFALSFQPFSCLVLVHLLLFFLFVVYLLNMLFCANPDIVMLDFLFEY